MPNRLAWISASLLLGSPVTAAAAPPAPARASAEQDGARDDRWIRRWPPERNMVELGIFGGLIFPSRRLELFEPDLTLPEQGFERLRRVSPELGLRAGFFPSRFLGVEVEGAGMPSRTDVDRDRATLWAVRGHLVGQLGLWSVTPFVVAGPSLLGVVSPRSAVGKDVDLGLHFGGGVKIFINRYIALRFDVRDTLTAKRGVSDGVGHTVELLAGLTVTLNRGRTRGPRDRDKDGILDAEDRCVDVPGVPQNEGCPWGDRDHDGIADRDDQCPDTPGVEVYNGCPPPDTDGDGILDPDDKCVDVPENDNDYQDDDGCPDEIPAGLEAFAGVIEGIYFDTNKASVKAQSRDKLDHAVEVLTRYPDVRVEISGHTDDVGRDDYNMDLSARRAEAVRKYLVDHGIANDRFETRGVGKNEPRADNATPEGRALNRRIEFKLLSN